MTRMEVLHLERLQHEATSGTHSIILDEPADQGGDDRGMSPYEILLAALGGCMAMTVRLYATRKGWPLDDVKVTLAHDKTHAKDCDDCVSERAAGVLDVIRQKVELTGDLTDEQQARLQEIAARCPVHRTLTGTIEILSDDSI
jgi:putative redox protein